MLFLGVVMSVLSDMKILERIYQKELHISPFQVENIQPSSVDLTLDEQIEIPKKNMEINAPYPDSTQLKEYFTHAHLGNDGYILQPGEFILGQIKETLSLSEKLVGNIQNRNSVIRLGVNVGLSSYINPGYEGKLPIAIHNVGSFSFHLIPGMRICQLVLSEAKAVLKDYSKRAEAKYHAEKNITLSRLSEDKEFIECFQKFGSRTTKNQLIEFLNTRITEKSRDFINHLSEEQKKLLGLT